MNIPIETIKSYCGTPHPEYKITYQCNCYEIGNKYHLPICQRVTYCPNCQRLEEKSRKNPPKCLKCDKVFVPTCKVVKLCKKCWDVNRGKDGEWYEVG